jgi:hypothetical protein
MLQCSECNSAPLQSFLLGTSRALGVPRPVLSLGVTVVPAWVVTTSELPVKLASRKMSFAYYSEQEFRSLYAAGALSTFSLAKRVRIVLLWGGPLN